MLNYYRDRRAIAGLDPVLRRGRRALYERRAALIAQLRSVQRPVPNPNHPRAAVAGRGVRKVESEAASAPATPRARGGDRGRAGDAFRATTRADGAAGQATPRRAALATPAQPQPPAARPPQPRACQRTAAVGQNTLRATPAARRNRRSRSSDAGSAAAPTATHGRARRAPTIPRRRPDARFRTSPPTPTISAAPPRKPTAPRERPTPTCRSPRRNRPARADLENRGADPDAPIL